ncbi:hypothetical protein SAMN04488542_112117 [Fontibacillus panacisegetis]|uniref:Uncharacterized protein n=1 Tax=Fontibacillus panacisegetis TaxID=670482 RepID=A0A1G7M0Y4_9BACL|nr:hypothetical protein [Fontibacillus panacisegetis]SDF54839.1 hypothetical protein SAMN04488542_112117 [Fontibacillus panacisegetis]
MTEADYLKSLRKLIRQGPDILLLHESPEIREQGLPGNPVIYKELQGTAIPLVQNAGIPANFD